MAHRLPPVDAVTVGVGWTGGILAHQLAASGLKVVGLERGGYRATKPDFQPPHIHDELRYAVRYELMQDLSRETVTFRNNRSQRALPMRTLGSFLLGEGLGGAGVHWNGQTWRFLPYTFEARSRAVARYGEGILPQDNTIQDWGVTYDELAPFYDRFERTCGVGGVAGNLGGAVQPGGNPFEGPRGPYPNPPMKTSYAQHLYKEAAEGMGLHPFPGPSANSTTEYTNPDGMQLGACHYCGYCERFGCEIYAKASPQATVIPAALKTGNFELRTGAHVTRVLMSPDGTRATGVLYVDAQGREVEQPAEMVLLTAYGLHNARLMMLSGIGETYDPATGRGTVGRNYAYQAVTSATVFFDDKDLNTFAGAGAMGTVVDDFNGDNFDHTGLGFVDGASLGLYITGHRPINTHPVPDGTPSWGPEWKRAVAKYFNRAATIVSQGAVMSYRGNYLDLDPTYRDAYGQPLLRMTFDWGGNERRMTEYLTDRAAEIARAMDPTHVKVSRLSDHYSIVPYQTTHNTGGTVMGTDPETSVVNPDLQVWGVDNVFVMGAGVFPQNAGYNPTGTVGALAYRAADAIVNRYVPSPGPLH